MQTFILTDDVLKKIKPQLRQNKRPKYLPGLQIYTQHKVPNIRIKD